MPQKYIKFDAKIKQVFQIFVDNFSLKTAASSNCVVTQITTQFIFHYYIIHLSHLKLFRNK